ncbi:MAG: PrsW family intramembrane metalloprotease [Lachnospiraceae bacterium]|nr:PrsW family intramembrane metalloprotease [Lachnospiraceae bacterium]
MLKLAIIPSIVLFFVVWKFDTVEKEPPGLLIKLFLCGALTVISAMVIGLAGEAIVVDFFEDESSLWYVFIDNFILTALVEEGGKCFVLKKITWRNKEFNYTFDGVVYAVVVSLGFATLENIFYVFEYGAETAIVRALLSVPGHVIDAVFMGYFYGLARYDEGAGNKEQARLHLKEALFVPVVMHGFYDFCLSTNFDVFYLLFAVYEVVITITTVKRFVQMSKGDTLIPGMEWTVSRDESTKYDNKW